jgi:sulfonate transport system ATP-binding protein
VASQLRGNVIEAQRPVDGVAVADAAPAPIVVEASGIRRRFEDREVLGGLDLSVRQGEFVTLLGASGCGKSTLLRVLAGLDEDADGDVRIEGGTSVVFQEPRLLPWKRVSANVRLGLDGPDRAARVAAALDSVGLRERADAWPATLSGGEAQRVALARALVREPSVLLLDEPFAALDALTRLRMQNLLRRIYEQRDLTVLFVTHDVDEALLLADRAVVLDGGVVAEELAVDLPRPRRRDDPHVSQLRRALLDRLGVPDELTAD